EMGLPCFCSMSELETLSKAGMLFQPDEDGLSMMLQQLKTGEIANPYIFEKTLDKSVNVC
ncbi:MAG: hypothetical protein K2N27_05005, partial [Ruminococcus sp.]|nr:hypothetical protein [Ruminococcus sp.]